MAVLSNDVLQGIRTAEESNFEPVPEGEYLAKATAAEVKETKNGRGQYIKMTLTILGPKFQGRKLFTNFNLINDNPEAARIGKQQVKSFMTAGGMSQEQINRFNDTDQLLGLTCKVRVSVDDDGGAYGPQNRIKSFKKPDNAPISAGNDFSDAFSSPSEKPWFA